MSVFWRNARRHSLNKLLHVEMHALVFARSKWDCAYCRETESMRSNLHKSWPFWKNNVPLNLTLNTLYYLYIGDSHRDLIWEESYSLEGVKVSFEKCDKNVSITVTSSLQSTGSCDCERGFLVLPSSFFSFLTHYKSWQKCYELHQLANGLRMYATPSTGLQCNNCHAGINASSCHDSWIALFFKPRAFTKKFSTSECFR